MDNKIKIVIEVDSANGIAQIKGIGDAAGQMRPQVEAAAGGISGALTTMQAKWAAIAAAAYAAYKVMNQAAELVSLAARYETLGVVMRVVGNNAGYTAAQMEKFAQGLQQTGISLVESRSALTKMAQAQLDLNKSSQLARIAQDAAVIGNMNSSEAFAAMIHGIQSGQVEVLRTIGINVTFEQGYAELAKTLRITTADLTEAQKSASRMNTVLDAGPGITGAYTASMETAGKQIKSLSRYVEDAKVMLGGLFTPALSEIVQEITGSVKGLNEEISGAKMEAIKEWGIGFRLQLIDVGIEVRKLAMSLDLIGLAAAQVPILATAPFAWMGGSGKKAFEAASDAAIMFGNRYETLTNEIIALDQKAQALRKSQTPEGQQELALVEKRLEQKRLHMAAEAKLLKDNETLATAAANKAAAATDKAVKEAAALQKAWADTSRSLANENTLAGLAGTEKALKENFIAAEKLKKEYAGLPAALKQVAYAEIDKNKAIKDAADIEKARRESADAAAKSRQKEADAAEAAAKDYDALMASIDPVQDRSRKLAEAQEIVTAALGASSQAAVDAMVKVRAYYAALDTTEVAKSLKQFLKEVEGIGGESGSFAGNSFGNAQADNIGKAITALAEMNQMYAAQKKAVEELAAARVAAEKMVADTVEQQKAREIALAAVTAKEHSLKIGQIDGQLSAYRTMFGAVGNLFEENSRERKAMHNIEMALAAVEIAMNAQKAISAAVVAVTTQGAGDPLSAFVRIAAMAALMAGVLSQLGVSFGGGGGAAAAPALPASTVLGAAAGTGSESADNGWQLLEDTYKMEYRELTQVCHIFVDSLIFQLLVKFYGHYSFYGSGFSWQRDLLEVQAYVDLPMFRFGVAAKPYMAVPDTVSLFDIVLYRQSLMG